MLALAAVGVGIAALVQAATGHAAVTVTATPLVVATSDQPPATTEAIAQTTPTIAPATPWGVLGIGVTAEPSTVEPPAVVAEQPSISLLGPPAGSQFRQGDTVTLYWDWPGTLQEGWRFALYIGNAGGQTLVGTAEAGNLGTLQQAAVVLESGSVDGGEAQWWVAVEDATAGTIATSERRVIVVLATADR